MWYLPNLVQQFLHNGNTLQDLERLYGISVKRHGKHPNLVLLKYDQIESPLAEPLVRECRGIILDESNDWAVVARGFDKFFNHGEGHAADIDWTRARVQEKLDGSLCMLYSYKDEWHVATTGTPDASGKVHGLEMTFAELFWQTMGHQGLDRLPRHPHVNFVFELTTPYNRVVVRHEKPSLTLIGIRMATSQKERPLEAWAEVGWPVVREFPLSSFEDIIQTFDALDPLKQEGYVVVDSKFNRVKVKHPGYVALHHLKGEGVTSKRLLEIVRTGETTEFLTHFPEWTDDFTRVKGAFEQLVTELERQYAEIKDISVQKDFALQATHSRCSGALFQLRAGRVKSVREFLAHMSIDSLTKLLGVK